MSKKDVFIKKITSALTGTLLSQFIPILVSPILSRIFSPEVFGVYSVFIAISMIGYALSSLSFDHAISVSEDDKSFSLLKLSLMISLIINTTFFIIMILSKEPLGNIFGLNESTWIFPIIPIYSFLYSIYMGCYFIYIKYGEINKSANLKITMSLLVVFSNLSISLFYRDSSSLVVSQIFAYVLLIIMQIKPLKDVYERNCNKGNKEVSFVKLFIKYKAFPIKYMPSNLLNIISTQIPALMISNLFGTQIAGYYSLTNRALNAPTAAIGAAFGDVYRNEAYVEMRKTGSTKNIFRKVLLILIILGGLPFIILLFFSPKIFESVFGINWLQSGIMASYMTLMYLARFLSVPLSFTLIIYKKYNVNLYLQLLLVIGSLLAFYVGKTYFNSWHYAIILYTANSVLLYLIILVYSKKLANTSMLE